MNAYPVRLAAGLTLIALCALAEEPPNAKMAEPQMNPATARNTPPPAYGWNSQPVQLPTQYVDGLREHMDRVNRDLHLIFQRQAMAVPHALDQKALSKNTRLEAFLPLEEGSNRSVALPILRSSW
ncbi:MAG TPA: hypothetical protein VGP21_08340 [Opitutaceae bacterium]|jgi:hypothetical protein|nr:hypothetical protein [Opitutaceae bacterium]